MRDLSKTQFNNKLKKYNITPTFCGYYHVTKSISVYARNGGNSRREQLAYLIKKQKEAAQQLIEDKS